METLKNLSCGCLGGVTAKVVESPFDTVKVRFQHATPNLYKSYSDCTLHVFRAEGWRGFFRGLPAPMIGGGMENAISFAFFSFGQRFYRHFISPMSEVESPLRMPEVIFAGAVSGLACSFALTPTEMVKCTLQVQDMKPRSERPFTGVVDCFAHLARTEGVHGMYRGHTATMARETPGNAGFFASYYMARRCLAGANESVEDLPLWKLLLAGGFGGVGYWSAFFPADVVKTKMQVDPHFQQLGLLRGLRKVYMDHGIRGLYSGWGITVIRAFPANAIIFTVYEWTSLAWEATFESEKEIEEKEKAVAVVAIPVVAVAAGATKEVAAPMALPATSNVCSSGSGCCSSTHHHHYDPKHS